MTHHHRPVHVHHHERTTVKETDDDYECDEDGCRPVEAERTKRHQAPGVISKLKQFLLGPTVEDDLDIVESDVRIVHVHRHEKLSHGHKRESADYIRDRTGEAREQLEDTGHKLKHKVNEIGDKAHNAKEYLREGAEAVEEKGEEVVGKTKNKAGGAFDVIWNQFEKTKEKLDHVLHGSHRQVQRAEAEAEDKIASVKHKASDKYHAEKDKVADIAVKKLDAARHKLDNVKEKVYDQYENLKFAAEDEYGHLKGTANEEYEKARHRVHDKVERTRQGVHHKIDRAEETAEEIASRAKQTASQATDAVKHVKDAGKETLHKVADNVKHTLEDTAHRIKDGIDNTKDNIKETAQRVKGGVREGVDTVKESMKEGMDSIKGGAEGVLHRVEQAAECLGCVGPRKHTGYLNDRLGARPWEYRLGYSTPALGANPVPVTAFYTALSSLWFLWLARRVWMSRNRAKIFVGDGSAELAREISREIVVSRTTVSENRTEKTTAILHTENTPAIKKTLNLMRAVDARATFTTNIPLYLILLGTLELAGAYRPLLHILSLVYLIGNVFQTEYGIWAPDGIGRGRPIGLAINWAVLLMGAVMAGYSALSCQGCPA